MSRRFNPVVIHELAAQLYWRLVWQLGPAEADSAVRNTQGKALLVEDHVKAALGAIDAPQLPAEDLAALFAEALVEAVGSLEHDRPLLGQFYLEDLDAGRAPSVEHFVTDADLVIAQRTPARCTQDPAIPVMGKLVIRSPLPAVVVATESPSPGQNLVRVEDSSALDAEYPLYLMLQGVQQIADDAHLLVGVFQIPVPDDTVGKTWAKLLPNSGRFVRQLSAYREDGTRTMVEITW